MYHQQRIALNMSTMLHVHCLQQCLSSSSDLCGHLGWLSGHYNDRVQGLFTAIAMFVPEKNFHIQCKDRWL